MLMEQSKELFDPLPTTNHTLALGDPESRLLRGALSNINHSAIGREEEIGFHEMRGKLLIARRAIRDPLVRL